MSEIDNLKAAGWATGRWAQKNCFRDGTFTYPVLLALAKDRDYKAISDARNAVWKTDQYRDSNADVQKQLLAAAKPDAIQKRVQNGTDFRSVARKLGHIEINGNFSFESENGRIKRFGVGNCALCGISGHGVVSCSEYNNEKDWQRSRSRLRGSGSVPINLHVANPDVRVEAAGQSNLDLQLHSLKPNREELAYNDDYDACFRHGLGQGYNEGHKSGYNLGFDHGHSQGYNAGHDTGYQVGHRAGFNEGWEACIRRFNADDGMNIGEIADPI